MEAYLQQKAKDNANRLARYVLKIWTDIMTKQELQCNQLLETHRREMETVAAKIKSNNNVLEARSIIEIGNSCLVMRKRSMASQIRKKDFRADLTAFAWAT